MSVFDRIVFWLLVAFMALSYFANAYTGEWHVCRWIAASLGFLATVQNLEEVARTAQKQSLRLLDMLEARAP